MTGIAKLGMDFFHPMEKSSFIKIVTNDQEITNQFFTVIMEKNDIRNYMPTQDQIIDEADFRNYSPEIREAFIKGAVWFRANTCSYFDWTIRKNDGTRKIQRPAFPDRG